MGEQSFWKCKIKTCAYLFNAFYILPLPLPFLALGIRMPSSWVALASLFLVSSLNFLNTALALVCLRAFVHAVHAAWDTSFPSPFFPAHLTVDPTSVLQILASQNATSSVTTHAALASTVISLCDGKNWPWLLLPAKREGSIILINGKSIFILAPSTYQGDKRLYFESSASFSCAAKGWMRFYCVKSVRSKLG